MSLLNVKLSDKLVTKESQLIPLEVGQFISGLDFGDVKNGDLSSDVEEYSARLEEQIIDNWFFEALSSTAGVALGLIKDEEGSMLYCAIVSLDEDDVNMPQQFIPIYSNKPRQFDSDNEFNQELIFTQGWQNLVNGKLMFPNDIVVKVAEFNPDITGWNGVIVGAIKSEYALESKEVTPRIGDITVEPSEGYYGFSSVTVKSVESGLQSKVVEPQKTNVIVEPDSKYFGMSRVVVNSVANRLQEKVVEPQLSDTTVSADSEYIGLSQVTVRSVADKLQAKEVQPQKESITVNPDVGKLGFSEVTVGAVTSDIDSNIVPENIKSGVNILGVQGTMQGAMEITDFSFFHYNGARLKLFGKYDTRKATNFDDMFAHCDFSSIEHFDTSSGKRFAEMFLSCLYLEIAPLINISNASTTLRMFADCRNLKQVSFFGRGKAVDCTEMFRKCVKLTTIPQLDLDRTANTYNMFYDCKSLQNLTLLNVRVNLQIGSGTSWGHLLTIESLTQIISELIKGTSAHTLTVGSANLEKLANVYVRLTVTPEEDTTDKLPFEVCTSTDEGAILITEYATLKNWNIK